MTDKNIMIVIFSSLIFTSAYQVFSLQNRSAELPVQTHQGSVLAVECTDCLDGVSDYCELEENACADDSSCAEWLSCTQSCIDLNLDADCYNDCDEQHVESHNECSSFRTCACVVCVGSCVDMCVSE